MLKFKDGSGNFRIEISVSSQRALLNYCREAGYDETGGILIGKYINDNRTAKVSFVTAAPPDSKKGRTWFIRGLRGLQDLVDRFWATGKGYYLGEWHYHPHHPARPSSQDIQQMRAISSTKSYNCIEPILLILGGDPEREWEVSATVVTPKTVVFLNRE